MARKKVPKFMYPAAEKHEGKRRYVSERQAREAADLLELQNPGLELDVYKDIDGGWYLTSVKKP